MSTHPTVLAARAKVLPEVTLEDALTATLSAVDGEGRMVFLRCSSEHYARMTLVDLATRLNLERPIEQAKDPVALLDNLIIVATALREQLKSRPPQETE